MHNRGTAAQAEWAGVAARSGAFDRRIGLGLVVLVAGALAGCAGQGPAQMDLVPGTCDAGLARAVAQDTRVRVLRVQAFRAGERVALEQSPPNAPPSPVDFCLVKLVVGPGEAGPTGAPYASAGIGIEIMLPASTQWNGTIRSFGSGGWAGGAHTDPSRLSRTGAVDPIHLAAVGKGYAVSASDHGHAGSLALGTTRDASFAWRADGSVNSTLWADFSERSMHELAVQTKALVRAYYGRPQRHAYWDGFSTGGRQGYKIAQRYPEDFDGILAGAPAFNWTRFITSELYPQVVMQRELGGVIPASKLDAASAAANAACGAGAMGFQIDPRDCRYDPTRDAALLCEGVAGTEGVRGAQRDAQRCLSLAQARVLNQIWHGQTTDGSHPDPATRGLVSAERRGGHLWWGLMRGTTLGALAGARPFPIASAQVALQLQDIGIAQADQAYVVNPSGTPRDGWRSLDYAALARAYDRGLQMQSVLGHINTDDANLSAARDAGVKILSYHGWADELITGMGSVEYFERAARQMGGVAALQRFNRLFMIPGHAHDSTFGRSGSIDPTTGRVTSPDKVPLPQPASGRDELFMALRNWVETGVAPQRIDVRSRNGSVVMPLCSYPAKAVQPSAGAAYECR